MPKMNIDEQFTGMFEPIELVFDGETLTVGAIEASTLENLVANTENPQGMREGFALLVGKDKKSFNKTDFRKIALAMQFINASITEQIEKFQSKNVPRGGAKATR